MVIVVASFWSTAVVEIGAVLLILNALTLSISNSLSESSSSDRDSTLPIHVRWAIGSWVIYVLGILISFRAAGVPFSRHPGLLWHPLVFPAVLLTSLDMKKLNRIGISFLVSGTCSASVALIRYSTSVGTSHALAGFVGVTTYADLLALAGVVAALLFSRRPTSSKEAWIIAVAGLVIVFAIFKTFELAPIIVLFGAVTIIVYALPGSMKFAWMGLVTVAVLVGPSIPLLKFSWLIHGHSVDRYIVWQEGAKLLSKAPLFGYGPECYRRILPSETWSKFANRPPGAWHNDILETGLDSGIITSVALIILIAIVLYHSIGAMRMRSGDFPKGNARALNFLLVSMVGFGLIGNVITTSILSVMFWIVMGLSLQSAFSVSTDQSESAMSSQRHGITETSLVR